MSKIFKQHTFVTETTHFSCMEKSHKTLSFLWFPSVLHRFSSNFPWFPWIFPADLFNQGLVLAPRALSATPGPAPVPLAPPEEESPTSRSSSQRSGMVTWWDLMQWLEVMWVSGWWFGTFFLFPYMGKNHPNWLSYFSEGLKPPTRYDFPSQKPPFSSGIFHCNVWLPEGSAVELVHGFRRQSSSNGCKWWVLQS